MCSEGLLESVLRCFLALEYVLDDCDQSDLFRRRVDDEQSNRL